MSTTDGSTTGNEVAAGTAAHIGTQGDTHVEPSPNAQRDMLRATQASAHRIIVVGGGAGGLELVTRLGDKLGKRGQA